MIKLTCALALSANLLCLSGLEHRGVVVLVPPHCCGIFYALPWAGKADWEGLMEWMWGSEIDSALLMEHSSHVDDQQMSDPGVTVHA
jgi:hypothetical protein